MLQSRFIRQMTAMQKQGPNSSMSGAMYTAPGGYFIQPTAQNVRPMFQPLANAQLRPGVPRWGNMSYGKNFLILWKVKIL